jgi:lipopolysaccharide exporter
MTTLVEKVRTTVHFLNRTDGSLKGKTIRSAVWVGISNAGLGTLGMARTIALARLLSPEVFGLMSICTMVQRGIDIFTETGFGAALIHRQDRYEEARNTAFSMTVFRGFLVGAVVFLVAPFVASYYGEPVLEPCIQVMALGFCIVGFTNINTETRRKELNFKSLAYLQQATSVVSLVIVVTLAYLLRSIWALVIGQVLTVIVNVLLSYVMIEGRPTFFFNRTLAKELFGYGKFITGVAIFGFIASEIDNAVVGKVLGMEALGFYAIAFKLASLPATHFSKVTARMMFPVCSKLQNDRPALRSVYVKVMQFVGHLAIPVSIGMALMAPEIVRVLYGERWLPAVVPLQVLSLYGGVTALGSWGYVFNALGKPHIPFYLNLGRALGIGALIYPMTAVFGLAGAAWAVALPMVVHFLVQVVVISRELDLETTHLVKILGAILRNSGLMAVALLASERIPLASPAASLGLAVAVGAITYVALNYKDMRKLAF